MPSIQVKDNKLATVYPLLQAKQREAAKQAAKVPTFDSALYEHFKTLSFKQFNETIGLPTHPRTYEERPLTPYQLEFYDAIDKSTKHKFHINKARQMGFSELMLRIPAYRAFNKYEGKQVKIIAGTRSIATKKLIDRLKMMFRRFPTLVDKENSTHDLRLRLINGTSYEGLPANPEAATGDTKIACFVLDEATKWDLKDDRPVLNSIMPIVHTNRSDLFEFGTPKGPRGFHYEIEQERDTNEWEFFKYSIWATEGNLYTRAEIEQMLADKTIDVAQEYLNQYTTGKDSVFGSDFPTGGHELEAW